MEGNHLMIPKNRCERSNSNVPDGRLPRQRLLSHGRNNSFLKIWRRHSLDLKRKSLTEPPNGHWISFLSNEKHLRTLKTLMKCVSIEAKNAYVTSNERTNLKERKKACTHIYRKICKHILIPNASYIIKYKL